MKVCEKCGLLIPRGRLCQTCQKYKRNGGVWHQLPAYGAVEYDDEGRPICHICGMALDKLIEHTKRKHGLNSEEYRAEFGLMRKNARLTSPKYADKMHEYSETYKTHEKNFEPVHSGRVPSGRRNPKWSPQEIESRRGQQSEKVKQRYARMTPEQWATYKAKLSDGVKLRLKQMPPERLARNKTIWTKNLPNEKREIQDGQKMA